MTGDGRRLENLDTDIAPPQAAMAATRAAIGEDEAKRVRAALAAASDRT